MSATLSAATEDPVIGSALGISYDIAAETAAKAAVAGIRSDRAHRSYSPICADTAAGHLAGFVDLLT